MPFSEVGMILSRVGYVTQQITSHRIGYSEFIPHSLLHLTQFTITITAISSIIITSTALADFTIHTVTLLITHCSAGLLYRSLLLCVNSGVPVMSPRGGGGRVFAGLLS
jgi:hypothetical protein